MGVTDWVPVVFFSLLPTPCLFVLSESLGLYGTCYFFLLLRMCKGYSLG